MDPILKDLNRRIDHAVLKPQATERDIVAACRDAVQYNLFAVCVNPVWVKTAAQELAGSTVKPISVAGFPLGAERTDIKILQAIKALQDGATEIDMVANIGWLVDGRLSEVESEIQQMRTELPTDVLLKVIIETALLDDTLMASATKAVIAGRAQFVKTSTGFSGPCTPHHINVLHAASKALIEVKASGGIKTPEDCYSYLQAGATRLGTSSSVTIMQEWSAHR